MVTKSLGFCCSSTLGRLVCENLTTWQLLQSDLPSDVKGIICKYFGINELDSWIKICDGIIFIKNKLISICNKYNNMKVVYYTLNAINTNEVKHIMNETSKLIITCEKLKNMYL